MGLISPITGRFLDKFGGKWLAVTGFALLTSTSVASANLSTETTFRYITVTNAACMIGTSMMMPVTTESLEDLTDD